MAYEFDSPEWLIQANREVKLKVCPICLMAGDLYLYRTAGRTYTGCACGAAWEIKRQETAGQA